jgi:hypothetical protein
MVRDTVSLKALDKARLEALKYGFKDIAGELEKAIEYYSGLLQTTDGEIEVEDMLPDYEEMTIAGEEIQEKKLRENYAPASPLLSIADFKAYLAGSKPLLVREGRSIRLEAVADPQEVLQRTYNGWARTVTLSATVSAELLEAILSEEVTLLRAGWPYGDNLRAKIVTGLTTKYEKRDEKMLEDIRWVLGIAGPRKGCGSRLPPRRGNNACREEGDPRSNRTAPDLGEARDLGERQRRSLGRRGASQAVEDAGRTSRGQFVLQIRGEGEEDQGPSSVARRQ